VTFRTPEAEQSLSVPGNRSHGTWGYAPEVPHAAEVNIGPSAASAAVTRASADNFCPRLFGTLIPDKIVFVT